MDSLRKKLWERLQGKSEKLDQALTQAEQGDKKALEIIAKNLDVEMDNDETFATEIKTLAQQIQAGKIQDNSNMTLNSTGDNNRNIQAKAEHGGKQYIAEKMYFGVQETD
jgi:hypothetical protein